MQESYQYDVKKTIKISTAVKTNDQNYTRGKEIASRFEYFVVNNHWKQASLVDSSWFQAR